VLVRWIWDKFLSKQKLNKQTNGTQDDISGPHQGSHNPYPILKSTDTVISPPVPNNAGTEGAEFKL
jgi:hypothetical protein